MIAIEGLTKQYGRGNALITALEDVSFSVADGQIVGFVGLNGAGKTSTIRIACGVALPSSGRVLIDSHDIVTDKRKASEQIGWVPEFPNFEQNAKAKSLLFYFAGFRGIERDAAERRAGELFQLLELSGQEDRRLRDFSQGMKKRFSLLLALLHNPRNLLFDELLNGLDPKGIRSIRDLVAGFKSQGRSVLLSSHILSEVEAVSDRVVFIHKGSIVKTVTREELDGIERGGSALKMAIPNLDVEGLRYLRTLGSVDVKGVNVTLSDFHDDPATVSSELIRRGLLLREFSLEKSSLEDYFFKLVGVTDDRETTGRAAGKGARGP